MPLLALTSALLSCGDDGPDAREAVVTATGDARPATGAAPGGGSDDGAGAAAADVLDTDGATAAAVDVRVAGCGPRVGVGAGSLLDDDLVVTAAHVVAGADAVDVVPTDGALVPAEVVLFDPELDLALLRATRSIGDALPVRSTAAAPGETGIVVLPRRDDETGASGPAGTDDGARAGTDDDVGTGLGAETDDGAGTDDGIEMDVLPIEVTRAVTIRTTDIYLEREVVRAGFELAATIEVGDSGAVVVLPGGAAGVVWARSTGRDDRAWAIDLPPVLHDDARRAALVDPVETGRCTR